LWLGGIVVMSLHL